MTKRTSRVLKVLVISLATVAISRGGVVLAATLPVATLQSSIEKELRTPTHLVVGTDGSLYVADPANRGVLKFSSSGKLLQKFAVKGIPHGVALTADGRLLVSQKETVTIHNAAGTEIGRLGSVAGQFVAASDITVDDAGLIYVTDSKGACVQVFTGGGAYLSRFGVKGSAAGEFRYPRAIAFEKVSKQLAVVDSLNGRVQFYDKNGAFVRSIGANGTGPLKFMHPQGVAFEYGAGSSVRMYVSDVMQRNIQAIDPATGTFLSYLKGKRDEHSLPSDLAFDQNSGKLYVADGDASITVYRITDGSVVVNSVTPATPGNAAVLPSTATTGGGSTVTAPGTTTVSPLSLSAVADGSTVTQELLDVTGLVSGGSAVAVNGQPVAVANGLFSTAVPLVIGANEITVTVADLSGKTWKEVRTVTRDAGAPVLTVAAPDVQATGNAILTLKGTTDRGAYVAVAGMPADISKLEWSAAVTLTPGLNTVEVQAFDLTGQASSQKRTVFYNASAPELAITAPAEDAVTGQKRLTITGKVTDGPGVALTAEVNGIPKKVTANGGQFSFPVDFTQEGRYSITLYAGAAGGDVSTVSRTIVYRKAP